MALRSGKVMLSLPSSLRGHSDFPSVYYRDSPVSSDLCAALRRRFTAQTPGSRVRFLHRLSPHAIDPTPGPNGCLCSLLPHRQWPSPYAQRVGVYPFRVYPHAGLSQPYSSEAQSRGCIVRFMLRPAALADTPDWVGPRSSGAVRGAVSGQVPPECYHSNAPSAYMPKRATHMATSFHVASLWGRNPVRAGWCRVTPMQDRCSVVSSDARLL